MSRKEILQILIDIIRDVLDDEHLKLTEETFIEDVEEWDSVAHMTIMALAESEFGIMLDIEQMVAVKCIKDIVELVSVKKGINI